MLVWVHRPTPHTLLHTVPDNPGDASFVTWTMRALLHALWAHPSRPFDGNAFFPHDSTLLFSDLLAGLALPYGVLVGAVRNPVLALNLLHLLLGLVALEVTYRLGRRLGVGPGVAVAAAVAFSFSSFTLAHIGHVNLQAVAVLPAGVLLLLRVVERPTVRRGAALGGLAAVTYLSVGYLALMLAIVVAVLGAVVFLRGGDGVDRRRLVSAGLAAGVVALALAGPVVAAFLATSADEGFERRPEEVSLGQLDPDDDLLQGAAGSLVFEAIDRAGDADPEHGLAPDAVMVAGVIVGAVAWLAGRRTKPLGQVPWGMGAFLLVALAGFLLALGPQPGVAGLTFRAARVVVPGFDTVRVPARLGLVLLFGLVMAGAIGWDRVVRTIADDRRRLVVGVALVAGVLLQATTTITRWPYDDRASSLAVYEELDRRPPGLTVALPMRDVLTTSGTLIEATRMVYSTTDWNDRVNGYSSFIPADYEARRAVLTTFPSPESMRLLDELGVRYVILEHGERSTLPMYSRSEVRRVLEALPAGARASAHGEAYLVELAP